MREASTESTGAATLGDHRHARVDGHGTFHARAHQRRVRTQRRHCLALHVRAHERAVRVVMLEEGNQRGRHRHDLLGADVHEIDVGLRHERELIFEAARHQVVGQVVLGIDAGVGLRDGVAALFDGRQVFDLVGDVTVLARGGTASRGSRTGWCGRRPTAS